LFRGDAAAQRFFAFAFALIERRDLPIAALSEQVDGSIGRNARNPRAKIVNRLVLLPSKLLQARTKLSAPLPG